MSEEFLSFVSGVQPGSGADEAEGSSPGSYSIAPGVVENNFDLIAEGRVQVRIPSHPAFSPWARMAAVGAGSGKGFLWIPQLKEEVLVAFNRNDERDAYILGGLWSTIKRPPKTLPSDFLIKRVIKTGVAAGVGHKVEFDDATQSITIESSTKQEIAIDPTKIELKNLAGSLSIKMDNTTQTISITAAKKLDLTAAEINLQAAKVSIQGGTSVAVQSGADVSIQAGASCRLQSPSIRLN